MVVGEVKWGILGGLVEIVEEIESLGRLSSKTLAEFQWDRRKLEWSRMIADDRVGEVSVSLSVWYSDAAVLKMQNATNLNDNWSVNQKTVASSRKKIVVQLS
jgi:hypothetical protein